MQIYSNHGFRYLNRAFLFYRGGGFFIVFFIYFFILELHTLYHANLVLGGLTYHFDSEIAEMGKSPFLKRLTVLYSSTLFGSQ